LAQRSSTEFTGSQRVGDRLEEIPEINGWVSPRLGIRFQLTSETLEIYRPDDRKFLTSVELDQLREQESQRTDREQQEKQLAQQQIQQEQQEKQLAQQQLEEERTLDNRNSNAIKL
jgi:membrane protein involved in colicin uptake